MNESDTVDVLIVTYNNRDTIGRCLESTRAALSDCIPGGTWTVSVFDNASSDGTAELLCASYPWARVHYSETNVLFGPAMNWLVRSSSSKYVILLNPDTDLRDAKISHLVEVLDAHADVGIVSASLVGGDGNLQPCAQGLPTPKYELSRAIIGTKLARATSGLWNPEAVLTATEQGFPVDEAHHLGLIWTTCCAMRRSDALYFGPFSPEFPMYDGDVDMCARMAVEGWSGYLMSDVRILHLGGLSSTASSKRQMMRTGRHAYYRKWYGGRRSLALRVALSAVSNVKRLHQHLGA